MKRLLQLMLLITAVAMEAGATADTIKVNGVTYSLNLSPKQAIVERVDTNIVEIPYEVRGYEVRRIKSDCFKCNVDTLRLFPSGYWNGYIYDDAKYDFVAVDPGWFNSCAQQAKHLSFMRGVYDWSFTQYVNPGATLCLPLYFNQYNIAGRYWKSSYITEENCVVIDSLQTRMRTISFKVENRWPEFFIMPDSIALRRSWDTPLSYVGKDANGKYLFTNLSPDEEYDTFCKNHGSYENITISYWDTRDNRKYKHWSFSTSPLLKSSVRCVPSQCSMTFSNVVCNSDETFQPTQCGIDLLGQYPADSTGCCTIDGLVPNTNYNWGTYAICDSTVYWCANRIYTYTKGLEPRININATPTAIAFKGMKTLDDATLAAEKISIDNGEELDGDTLFVKGLRPGSTHTIKYRVQANEGIVLKRWEEAVQTITLPEAEITMLRPLGVSPGNAIVAASTNICEAETNVGFQWKKTSAPDDMDPYEGNAAIFNGRMEAFLRNLQHGSDLYYRARAFYKADDGTYYYSDWKVFDTEDYSYLEPTVHTYPMGEVTSNSVTVQGYVLPGTDEIDEQGFEYWQDGTQNAPQRVPAESAPAMGAPAADGVSVVLSSGQVMTAQLKDLVPNTPYSYRAFVRTQSGTTYGEQRSFVSGEDPLGIGHVVAVPAERTVLGIYSLDGRKYDSRQKGFNIVRYSDGTSRKIFVK